MTSDEIIAMAQDAGFDWSGNELTWESVICTEELKAFAALVAAAEREACAKVCETHAPTTTPTWVSYAEAIRARGQHGT